MRGRTRSGITASHCSSLEASRGACTAVGPSPLPARLDRGTESYGVWSAMAATTYQSGHAQPQTCWTRCAGRSSAPTSGSARTFAVPTFMSSTSSGATAASTASLHTSDSVRGPSYLGHRDRLWAGPRTPQDPRRGVDAGLFRRQSRDRLRCPAALPDTSLCHDRSMPTCPSPTAPGRPRVNSSRPQTMDEWERSRLGQPASELSAREVEERLPRRTDLKKPSFASRLGGRIRHRLQPAPEGARADELRRRAERFLDTTPDTPADK